MIERLRITEVTLPAGHPRAGARTQVFGYLIHHPEGPVLFDTGVGTGHADIDRLFRPTHHDLVLALGTAGVAPEDVVMVINSHLHFDHCGNNRLFPGVPLVAQRAELDGARAGGYTVAEWVDFPGVRWQPVTGEAEVLDGLRVLPTPGHTAGHQSLVVQDGEHVDVVAGQAVYDPEELELKRSVEPLPRGEAAATAAAARAIKALRPRRVLFAHDEREWRDQAGGPSN